MRGGRIGLALAGAGTAATVTVVGLGVWLRLAAWDAPAADEVMAWWLSSAVAALGYGLLGGRLAARRPRLSVGWLLLGFGLANALALAGPGWLVYELAHRPERVSTAARAAMWVGNATWMIAVIGTVSVLPLLLPGGRLPSRRWRPVLAVAVMAVVGSTAQAAATPYGTFAPTLPRYGVRNPTGLSWAVEAWVTAPLVALTATTALAALWSLSRRGRGRPAGTNGSAGADRTTGPGSTASTAGAAGTTGTAGDPAERERRQARWVLLGLAASVVLFVAGFWLGPVLTALAMLPLPVACLVAVLRYQMWDVDLVVSRALAYGALTVVIGACYAACVGFGGALLGRTTGAPLVATALVAVFAEPLARRLRAEANRLVFGGEHDPRTVLSLVGARLRAAEDADTISRRVLPELAAAAATALRVPYAAIEVVGGETIEHGTPPPASPVSGSGNVPGDRPGTGEAAGPAARQGLDRIPLEYAGTRVGTLLLARRADWLRPAERRLLIEVTENAGVALHSVVLARDLRRSREQLVAAREEERRRLYRELHDGFGPVLAASALQAETARDLLPADPPAAARILDRVVPRLRGTVDDVRALVHGLRPPALDDLGLGPAVRELATRFAAPGLRVQVTADEDLGTLPAAAEVAAYRIVAEALTNAVRHGRPSLLRVVLARKPEGLDVQVIDDGRGLGASDAGDPAGEAGEAVPAAAGGMGLRSMRERVDELCGTFEIGPGPDGRGARVAALLPAASGTTEG
ncbi:MULTISPECIES: sensor histidine kinase [Pseudofrankia]|uniref:sensor histidine kinase n=1 Tax=Pseudofrankia TaxID=2994363 RepID=UPI000234BC0B|nr:MULTISPECIES: histidine kinase [Pseudofrankia]